MTPQVPVSTSIDTKVSIGARRQLIELVKREHVTTLRVVRAVPPGQWAFRPHPRSQSAFDLVWTLVREQVGAAGVLAGTWTMPPRFPEPPESSSALIRAFEKSFAELTRSLEAAADAKLDESVPFFTGKNRVEPVRIEDLLWFWVLDGVHHRGQLSVYVRMSGGVVPSIYGPSADEPWS